MLERADRVLPRVGSPKLSHWMAARHADCGVQILTGVDVREIRDGATRRHQVVLADQGPLKADVVLVAVGVTPRQGLAEESGLHCDDGIVVDEQARTSDDSIFAVGDATRRPVPWSGGGWLRLESIASAVEQARCAAAAITGQAAPKPEVP